jgi:hypothetical protein
MLQLPLPSSSATRRGVAQSQATDRCQEHSGRPRPASMEESERVLRRSSDILRRSPTGISVARLQLESVNASHPSPWFGGQKSDQGNARSHTARAQSEEQHLVFSLPIRVDLDPAYPLSLWQMCVSPVILHQRDSGRTRHQWRESVSLASTSLHPLSS